MAFEARNQYVYDLFKRAVYLIPRNQRRYVWDKRNWQELFEDVSLVIDSHYQKHFIGSIVLIDEGRCKGLPNYTIIDGQQRIITLTILLSSVMLLMKKHGMKAEFEGIKNYVIAKNDVAEDVVMVTSEYYTYLEKIIKDTLKVSYEEISTMSSPL